MWKDSGRVERVTTRKRRHVSGRERVRTFFFHWVFCLDVGIPTTGEVSRTVFPSASMKMNRDVGSPPLHNNKRQCDKLWWDFGEKILGCDSFTFRYVKPLTIHMVFFSLVCASLPSTSLQICSTCADYLYTPSSYGVSILNWCNHQGSSSPFYCTCRQTLFQILPSISLLHTK